MLKRNVNNPILTARPDLSWCSRKVYNCAVHEEDGMYYMLFRAVGDDWISRLGIAESEDGVRFTIRPKPVVSPGYPWESHGCEDPRMVKFGDRFFVTYTAFDGITARAAIMWSKDFRNWSERHLLFPDIDNPQRENLPYDWSKAAAIYPEKLGGKYYLLFGDNHIWSAVSDNMKDWEPLPHPILDARGGHFDSAYIEMGPPPIRTTKGWLVLYHGIDRMDGQRTYALGAALFDIDDPLKLIWRCSKPILSPKEPYETFGMVDIIDGGFDALKRMKITDFRRLAKEHKLPKAIFCCGAIEEHGTLKLYYSGGDTVICTGEISLERVFAS